MSKKQGRSFWDDLKTSAKKPFETWKKKPKKTSSEQEGASSTCGTVAPGAAGCSGASQQAHHDQGPKRGSVGTSASGVVAGASGGSKKVHYDKGNTSDLTSPQEKTNYSRLCRLLISVGSPVLRDTFDEIIPPQNLQTILKCDPAHSKLQSRRKEGILNSTQWSKLYPAKPSEVSSAGFDPALLILLLRTICNLSPPTAGWDTPPLKADTSRESDIVRVKYFLNTVSKHAVEGSVSDAVFSNYWQQIRNTLVRLGGGDHEDAIDEMKDQEMDPLDEEHFQVLFKQWKEGEENMKDKLNELESIEASKEEGSKRSDANAASSSQEGSGDPPQLSTDVPSISDIRVITKPSKHADLPVDVLLVTVKNCEFLACFNELKHPYRCYFDGLGYVYFSDGDHESQEEKVKIALLQCYKGGIGPSASLISVKNAVNVLRPKAVISVGTCSALSPEETKLGDVVVSAKIATYASKVVKSNQEQSTGMRSFVSRRFLDIIKHCADGWQAPLKNPEAQEIKVHSDGEFLSGPEQVSAEWRREQLAASNPQATAIEMEGEGIFTAAFDSQVEWLIVKGIADYADGAQLTTQSWLPCASVMAASLVTHILSDPYVFQSWPHYQDSSVQSSDSKSKEELPFPGDSATAFLEWSQNQLCSFYNTTASQVMITPWDPDNTMDIDEVYVQLSFLRDDRKLTGTTKEELQDYSEIFASHGHHLTPKRILVYGRPGIGKSTFSKKLAVDWSRGEKEILQKFAVVLLIKLRDVCNTQDLCAMLKKAELLSADDPMVFNQLYDYVIQNQQKVLLVLDGFDEYSAEKSSPVHQIWRGSQLRDCTVLVTTRLSKENELTLPSHVLFEVNGFDDTGKIKQFAGKFLSGQEDLDEFTDFLSKHKLWNMAEIPLLLLMLCLTWKDKGHLGQPTSRADLYESFFQTLLDHAIAKTSDRKFRSIDEYKEDLAKLGELAFDALLNDCLYFMLSKLPENIRLLIEKFIVVGFLQISKLSSSPRPEEVAYFLHKTIQEFLSAWFIVQELTNTKKDTVTSLSKVDLFEKVKKMEEVFRFVCELSSEATRQVLSHLRMIGEKEGLTEYNFTENPSVKELSEDQREFHRISLGCFLSCPASDRQDIYPLFLRCVNSVLVIDNQLPAIAREHFLRSSTKPDYFFSVDHLKESVNDDVFSIICDLETVIVTCYGDAKSISNNDECLFDRLRVDEFFLKKEGQQMVFYLTCIRRNAIDQCLRSAELLNALTSAPESPPQKPVDHVSQNQDASSSLDLNEKTSDHTQKHSLSFVREIHITIYGEEIRKKLTVVNNIPVLPFLSRPQVIKISLVPLNEAIEQECAQLKESLVSRIPFTNNLVILKLYNICCTANSKCAADFARSLHQAPNLDTLVLSNVDMGDQECQILATSLKNLDKLKVLRLSSNPLGHGITELAKHLHCVPHLTLLELYDTQMGKEEVIAVARGLKYVPELIELDLSQNSLGRGVTELIQYLKSIPELSIRLILFGVRMTKKEASELYTAVAQGRIKKLITDCNFVFTLCLLYHIIRRTFPESHS